MLSEGLQAEAVAAAEPQRAGANPALCTAAGGGDAAPPCLQRAWAAPERPGRYGRGGLRSPRQGEENQPLARRVSWCVSNNTCCLLDLFEVVYLLQANFLHVI